MGLIVASALAVALVLVAAPGAGAIPQTALGPAGEALHAAIDLLGRVGPRPLDPFLQGAHFAIHSPGAHQPQFVFEPLEFAFQLRLVHVPNQVAHFGRLARQIRIGQRQPLEFSRDPRLTPPIQLTHLIVEYGNLDLNVLGNRAAHHVLDSTARLTTLLTLEPRPPGPAETLHVLGVLNHALPKLRIALENTAEPAQRRRGLSQPLPEGRRIVLAKPFQRVVRLGHVLADEAQQLLLFLSSERTLIFRQRAEQVGSGQPAEPRTPTVLATRGLTGTVGLLALRPIRGGFRFALLRARRRRGITAPRQKRRGEQQR